MALTRNFKQTVVARVESDPAFSKALLDEAATLFLSGEPETARLILRDLVNATIGLPRACTACCHPKATPAWTTWQPSLAPWVSSSTWASKSALSGPPDRYKPCRPARAAAPGATPTERLNARLNADSD